MKEKSSGAVEGVVTGTPILCGKNERQSPVTFYGESTLELVACGSLVISLLYAAGCWEMSERRKKIPVDHVISRSF